MVASYKSNIDTKNKQWTAVKLTFVYEKNTVNNEPIGMYM